MAELLDEQPLLVTDRVIFSVPAAGQLTWNGPAVPAVPEATVPPEKPQV